MWKKPTVTSQPDSEAAAQAYVLRVLQMAWRSERELQEKLRLKGFSDEVAARAVEYARQLGYVDDMRLARGIARTYAESRTHGTAHLKAKLLSKKLSSDVIEQAVSEVFGAEQELAAARRAVQKLGYARKLAGLSYEEKQKLMARLHARGFRPGSIHAALGSSV